MCSTPKPNGNAVRGPLNALFFDILEGYINRRLATRKSRLFADLPGAVVEIGAGVGANFPYFKKGTHVIAVEPNPHMHPGLRRKARRCGLPLSILESGAETIDLPDNSVNAVVCTLVLCTVSDPARVLSEIRRILRPGGRFIFLEHVAAPHKTWRRRLQDSLYGFWRYIFEGCNTNRDTGALLRGAGFQKVDIEEYVMESLFLPVNSQIAGVATA